MNKTTTIGFVFILLLTASGTFAQTFSESSGSSWEAFDVASNAPLSHAENTIPFQTMSQSPVDGGFALTHNGPNSAHFAIGHSPATYSSTMYSDGLYPGYEFNARGQESFNAIDVSNQTGFHEFDVSDQGNWSQSDFSQPNDSTPWRAQVLPTGLIYPSYLAGRKEPRLGCEITNEAKYGWLWDITLGGRAPLFRYGTVNPIQPEGLQIDLEGAALLRLDFERNRELAATDYRAGLPITYGTRHWQYKIAYYHVSSHLGDNYILADFKTPRIQYVRDSIVLGVAWRPWRALRAYGEVGWAFHTGETTDPFEFQFGLEYTQPYRPAKNWTGSPFAAVDVHLFQELDFSGYINFQAGWQWRGPVNNLFRLGLEVYSGCDDQFQFHTSYQRKIGFGIWYDF